MANCHQCSKLLGSTARDGDCSICFAKGVRFCPTCAMWELGPKDTTEDMFAVIATAPKPKKISVSRKHSQESDDSTSSVIEVPLECDAFQPLMGNVCPHIKKQLAEGVTDAAAFTDDEPNINDKPDDFWEWVKKRTKHADTEEGQARLYQKTFKVYSCAVLDKFRALYPTCKYDRVAIQVLLFMYLSSKERVQCRFMQDKEAASARSDVEYLKRWQIRTVAAAHIEQHLADIGTHFGSEVEALVSKATWKAALGLDLYEYFLKGFISPTLFAIELKRVGGGTDGAREILEIATILYHVLTTTLTKTERESHWSQNTKDFTPNEALGFLSSVHYEALYGTTADPSSANAPQFCDATKAMLNQVWNVLGDTDPSNTLVDHPRFKDDTLPGSLDAVEKHYLQYLPTFDTPEDRQGERTECEAKVRERVVDMVKAYRPEYIGSLHAEKVTIGMPQETFGAKHGTSKYVYLSAPDLEKVTLKFDKKDGEDHVQTNLEQTEITKIESLIKELSKPSYLKAHKHNLSITISYEKGPTGQSASDIATTKRRNDRRDAVIQEIQSRLEDNGNPNMPAYWLEYIPDNSQIGEDGELKEEWDPAEYTDQMIKHMQDDFHVDQCFDDYVAKLLLSITDFVPKAWFPLKLRDKKYKEIFPDCGFDDGPKLMALCEQYNKIGGTSARPAHYVDWRNHKDVWLYDCFPIELRRRPLFCSLSLQPIVPEPNPNYGKHTLLFKRSTTRTRSVHTFGDKQQPRRSMLLLLDDIFHERPKKDGTAGQTAVNRVKVADDLFRRVENMATYKTMALGEQWEATLAGPPVPYTDGDRLIECQIFGPIGPSDFLGFICWVEDETWINTNASNAFYLKSTEVATKQDHLNTNYGRAELLKFKPSVDSKKFGKQDCKRPDLKSTPESKRRKLLDKKPY